MRLKVLQLSLVVIASVFVGVNSTQAEMTPKGEGCMNGCLHSYYYAKNYASDHRIQEKEFHEFYEGQLDNCDNYCHSQFKPN